MEEHSPNNSGRRLDSWKDIAGFFGRDERTVRRWERENALPVHRVPGNGKGRVFAYEAELSQWLRQPRTANNGGQRPQPTEQVQTASRQPGLRIFGKTALVLAVCTALVIGILVSRRRHGFAVDASARALPNRARPHAANPEAEDLYLKGRYYWNKRTPDGLNKAVDYFTQSLVRDPSFALAYVGLADCYNLLREYTLMPDAEAYPRALAAARKAVELDEQSSEAHASLAFALFYGTWDVPNADREFRRAIELDPNNATAHHWYATYLMTLRRFPESLIEIGRAQTLDPSSRSILADKGLSLLMEGRRDEGLTLLRQIETTEPDFRSPHLYLKENYLASADYTNFLVESRKDASLVHDEAALAVTAAAEQGYATGGAKGMFTSMLEAQKKLYDQGMISPVALARTEALLGNNEEAFRYLNIAFDRHDAPLLSIGNIAEFKSLHDDPSYRNLIDRMKLPHQN